MRKPDLNRLLGLAQRSQKPARLPLASLRPTGPSQAPDWRLPNLSIQAIGRKGGHRGQR